MPISTVVASIYNTSNAVVNTCATLFFISCVVFNFPGTICLNKFGLSLTFKVNTVIIILGLWLRYLVVMVIED